MDRILISLENLKRLVVTGVGYSMGHLYGISFGFNSPTKYIKFMSYEWNFGVTHKLKF